MTRPAGPGGESILLEIAAIARDKLGHTGPLHRDQRLVEDLELDSLLLLTLAVEVENQFEICLDEEDEAAIETLGDLVDAVKAKIGHEGK